MDEDQKKLKKELIKYINKEDVFITGVSIYNPIKEKDKFRCDPPSEYQEFEHTGKRTITIYIDDSINKK